METPITTVGDLIRKLESLGPDRLLIVDDDGSTHALDNNAIELWNPDDDESPVAIYAHLV